MPRLLFLIAILAVPAMALPSFTLNRNFGVGGKVVHSLGVDAFTQKIIAQPDGKMLAFGVLRTTQSSVWILRFNRNGSIDTTFGINGLVTTPLRANFLEAWHGGALLPNGKIVVGGNVGSVGNENFALARYNADGTLDDEFGDDGMVAVDLGGSFETVNAIAVQDDSKIVAAGKSNALHLEFDLAAARFNPDGSLDTSFHGNGKLIYPRNSADVANAAIIQPDGKVLIGGRVGPFCGVLRLNEDGSPDPTFSSGGLVVHTNTSIGKDLALQRDGKIISVGDGLVRFNADGTLDQTFGVGGRVTVFATFLSAVKARPDGRLVVAGNSSTALPGTDENFSTVLLGRNGEFITRIDTDFNGHERAEAILLNQDGSVITAGFVAVASLSSAVGLAKYAGLTRLTNTTADFDGDGRTDISVFRNGTWFSINSSGNGFNAVEFGQSTDKIAPSDHDGDARADRGVFRSGVWHQLASGSLEVTQTFFGIDGDIPLPADYDGDGKDDIAVFREGNWYMLLSDNGSFSATQFGIATDKPLRGDFDGDGKTDLAVYRDGSWYQLRSEDGFAAIQFGLSADMPVAGDYDGDRKTDIAVYRDGDWYIVNSTEGFTHVRFGLAADVPIPGDYDGDYRTDIAVYREGTWYLLQSSSGFAAIQFGLGGDIPIPSK